MENVMDSYRKLVMFFYANERSLIWMLKNGIGEPNERDTIQKYFNKFYAFAKEGILADFNELGKLTDSCQDILDRYSVLDEE